jgi:hypothetical protein
VTAGVLAALVAAATDEELDALADALRERLGSPDELRTTAEAAEDLRCDVGRIYELRRRGALIPQQDGRRRNS